MMSVLNRKFDLLSRSGTCPPYLLDVLSLLVAHANDTELFKTELRSAPFDDNWDSVEERRGAAMPLARQDARVAEMVSEGAAKASHETILLAAEQSLRTYAEDLRRINTVAMATSARELRELRATTRDEMDEFRDRLCEAAVGQSTRDLEVMKAEWLEDVHADAERLKNEVAVIASSAEAAVQRTVGDYEAFIAKAHEVLNWEPMVDAHAAVAASSLVSEQVSLLATSSASKTAVNLLTERMKHMERTVARVCVSLYDGGDSAHLLMTSHDSRNGAAVGESSAKRTPKRAAEDRGNIAAATSVLSPMATLPVGTRGTVRLHQQPSHSWDGATRYSDACADGAVWDIPLLGMNAEDDRSGDGVAVTAVQPGSPAADGGIRAGLVISHVGRKAVASVDALRDAIAAAAESVETVARLTVYDPEAGRVRIIPVDM